MSVGSMPWIRYRSMGSPLPLRSGWPDALGDMSSFIQLLKRSSDGASGNLSTGAGSVSRTTP